MKVLVFILAVLVTPVSFAGKADRSWCFCTRWNSFIVRASEDPGKPWDNIWHLEGTPEENLGGRCGVRGYILNADGKPIAGPFSHTQGRYTACFNY